MKLYLINKRELELANFDINKNHYPEDYISDITQHPEWIDELYKIHHITKREVFDKLNNGEFLLDCEGDVVSNDRDESLKYIDRYINEELDVFGNYDPPFISAVWDGRE